MRVPACEARMKGLNSILSKGLFYLNAGADNVAELDRLIFDGIESNSAKAKRSTAKGRKKLEPNPVESSKGKTKQKGKKEA